MGFIKKLLPVSLLKSIRPYYHGALALFASWYFGRPSVDLIVIGVTGTNGKTTTVNLIAKILEEAGFPTGYTSTATLNIDGKEILNPSKITMPSGWLLQKGLKQMFKRGCKYAVIEVSSEGLAQNRHLGINFDVVVFTNLTPEHLEAHGGFENYKQAKARLFASLQAYQIPNTKYQINPKLKKTIITNADDTHGKFYAGFKADQYLTYGVLSEADYFATEHDYKPRGVSYTLLTELIQPGSNNKAAPIRFNLQLKGLFDVYNSLAAIAAAQSQGIALEICKAGLEKVEIVPGRVEVIQSHPFTIVVDYAYEPEEMKQLYETLEWWPHNRVIQILGPTGGGRDRARIPVLGKMAGEFADIVIITTDDPYDDDPSELADEMIIGASPSGKVRDQTLYKILDRRAAIIKALQLASAKDLILITGKGADQSMALANGEYAPWDDRKVVSRELGFMLLERHKNLDHFKTHDFIH
ncbi:MAG: UDP-N-acetylmuramyl-tripeptide synthetase [Candidatus Doudnabacteria bacterium]|nr:UDP-N-acetylmuramyl-tripeptide synthetase [Candidatus Doudnabacteria bacterium]